MLIILVILLVIGFVCLVGIFIIFKKIYALSPQADSLLNKITQSVELAIKTDNSLNRVESSDSSKQLREEVTNSLSRLADSTSKRISELAESQKGQLDSFSNQMVQLIKINEEKFGRLEKSVSEGLTTYNNSVLSRIAEMLSTQRGQFETFTKQMDALIHKVEQKMEGVRITVEQKLQTMQSDNAQKLEQMRKTVDEKLHETLEKRLGESFRLVSERLELVHKGLGEMQTLASGVGDLKKVLTNVKIRGTLGEVQLGTLLDQMLAPDQYAKNVVTKEGSRENVEFAIKLPGNKEGEPVWLPIDAKFPIEDYQRLVEAQESGNQEVIDQVGKDLEVRIKNEAKDIRDKYINPPHTTDFGMMFLPFEGLYAEVLRRPGLHEKLQREYKITIVGPTTIAAFLNSLQMGFRTLAIEKRSNEVWNLLGQVKAEFSKFGDILDKANKQLEAVTNTMSSAATRTRVIERKLRDVVVLPSVETVPELTEEIVRNDVGVEEQSVTES